MHEFDNWIEALESEKYLQGVGVLKQKNKKQEDTYCCLGVLSEIRGRECKPYDAYIYSYDKGGYEFIPKPIQHLCSGWNDDSKFTFKEIAQLLRSHFDNDPWPDFFLDRCVAVALRNKDA